MRGDPGATYRGDWFSKRVSLRDNCRCRVHDGGGGDFNPGSFDATGHSGFK